MGEDKYPILTKLPWKPTRMSIQMRFLLLLGIVTIGSVPLAHGQIRTQAYQYNGGTFTIKTVFNFYTSVLTDGLDGNSRVQPIVTIANRRTGRSMTSSFISENDFISTIEGNVPIGHEMTPGQLNPRTNTGIVTIDASSLGSGPLVFTVTGVSELTARAPALFAMSSEVLITFGQFALKA
jgi:hypothetical protein